LTQIDKGRRQVLLNTEYTVEQIIKGVEQWNIAAKNHPNFEIPLPVKKGQKAQIAEPLCPSPASVMRCFQNQWIRQGQEKSPLAGCNLLEIYSVFLGEPNQTEKLYHKLLQLGLQRWMPLFLGIGQADHNHEITTFSTEARKTILTAISTFGILLYKLGYKKEGYMKEAAFNIGRLLSLADGLHKEYCKNVRKNEIPAQLIGNSLMPITLDNPKRGFARLSKRILIYIAWIDKGWESKDENKKKELRGARGHRNRMGEVCNILSKLELPEKTDDSQKAMILLGYLYKSKKKVNNEENKGIKQ